MMTFKDQNKRVQYYTQSIITIAENLDNSKTYKEENKNHLQLYYLAVVIVVSSFVMSIRLSYAYFYIIKTI